VTGFLMEKVNLRSAKSFPSKTWIQ